MPDTNENTEVQAETNETVEQAAARVAKTEAEKKAAANEAAQKHRAKVKGAGRVALQQWVPTARRDLLRKFLKLASSRHEAGDEAFFENLNAQLVAYAPVPAEPVAEGTETNG